MTAAPDVAGRVIGFRKWRMTGEVLTSPYIPLPWSERVVRARCLPADGRAAVGEWLREPHEAPHPSCQCGIYALHRPPQRGPIPDMHRTFGIVALWGRIAVHHDGMRAEHAEILALAYCRELGSRHRAEVDAIAERLAVPVVEHRRLASVASEFGDPLPPSLVP
jgi:hypothetical protein